MINPNIKLNKWYLESYHPSHGPHLPLTEEHGQPLESLDLPAVMNFPRLVREPELHKEEIRRYYDQLLLEGPFSLNRVNLITEMVQSSESPHPDKLRGQVQLETAYALILCYSLILNLFLSAFNPFDTELQQQALYLAREAIYISQKSATHLPIGAGFMPAGLFAAWVATDDVEIIQGIKETLSTYEVYYADAKYVRMFRELKRRAREIRQRSLDDLAMQGLDHAASGLFDSVDFDWGLGSV